jgi:ATP-dependent helicase/nuclease subunit B
VSNLTEATETMLRIAAVELDRFSFESPLWDATRIQMTGGEDTGPGIFSKFLVKESEEECSALVPSLFEFSFGMPATPDDDPASVPEPVGFSVGEETIRIKGRVDRIDVTPDGLFSICDYKTGSAIVSGKEIKEGKALQLPLYLSAYEQLSGKRGVAASYYRIRREVENKVVLLDEAGRDLICSSRPRPTTDFREVLGHSLGSAAESVRGIRNGIFSLVQEEKCPNAYCEFRFVCRFDPARVFSLNGEVG